MPLAEDRLDSTLRLAKTVARAAEVGRSAARTLATGRAERAAHVGAADSCILMDSAGTEGAIKRCRKSLGVLCLANLCAYAVMPLWLAASPVVM